MGETMGEVNVREIIAALHTAQRGLDALYATMVRADRPLMAAVIRILVAIEEYVRRYDD